MFNANVAFRGSSAVEGPIVIDGRPVSGHLRESSGLIEEIVEHIVGFVSPDLAVASERMRYAVQAMTGACLEVAYSFLDRRDPEQSLEELSELTARWARKGVPLDMVNHAVYEGAHLLLRMMTTTDTRSDYEELSEVIPILPEALARISAAISAGYVTACAYLDHDDRWMVRAVASALLGNPNQVSILGKYGVTVVEIYTVLAWILRGSDATHPVI